MIKIFIGALLFVVVSFKGICQDSTQTLLPKLSLRFNVLGLSDPIDNNFSVGIEKRFSPRWSTGSDIGWVFHSGYTGNINRTNGVIARPFIRYYQKSGTSFWETELHFKYVSYTIYDWIGRIPENNVPTYEELTNFKLNKHVAGIHFKGGGQSNLSRNKKFKLEYVLGTGVRFKWHKVPGGIYTAGRGIFINVASNETVVSPVLLINFRFVFVIE